MKRIKPLIGRSAGGFVKTQPKQTDKELLTPQHGEWRLIVCRRAGWQCQWVEDGRRCPNKAPEHRMYADHIVERQDGGALYDPDNGACMCASHHGRKTMQERARRAHEG